MFWILICVLHLSVCSYHVAYAFQSESTICSCLNVKELLARSRHKILSLSDSNWTRTQNHLVCKWTLNHSRLAKCQGTHCLKQARHLKFKWLMQCSYLKRICNIIRTYSQMHWVYKNSQYSSIIWPVWLNGWVFVYKLSGCGFKSSYSHWNFRFCTCF